MMFGLPGAALAMYHTAKPGTEEESGRLAALQCRRSHPL